MAKLMIDTATGARSYSGGIFSVPALGALGGPIVLPEYKPPPSGVTFTPLPSTPVGMPPEPWMAFDPKAVITKTALGVTYKFLPKEAILLLGMALMATPQTTKVDDDALTGFRIRSGVITKGTPIEKSIAGWMKELQDKGYGFLVGQKKSADPELPLLTVWATKYVDVAKALNEPVLIEPKDGWQLRAKPMLKAAATAKPAEGGGIALLVGAAALIGVGLWLATKKTPMRRNARRSVRRNASHETLALRWDERFVPAAEVNDAMTTVLTWGGHFIGAPTKHGGVKSWRFKIDSAHKDAMFKKFHLLHGDSGSYGVSIGRG